MLVLESKVLLEVDLSFYLTDSVLPRGYLSDEGFWCIQKAGSTFHQSVAPIESAGHLFYGWWSSVRRSDMIGCTKGSETCLLHTKALRTLLLFQHPRLGTIPKIP